MTLEEVAAHWAANINEWYGLGATTEEVVDAFNKNPKRNPHLKPGDRVKVDGYTGTVVRDLGDGQYEVRMPGGIAVKSLGGSMQIQ